MEGSKNGMDNGEQTRIVVSKLRSTDPDVLDSPSIVPLPRRTWRGFISMHSSCDLSTRIQSVGLRSFSDLLRGSSLKVFLYRGASQTFARSSSTTS